jgi:hypothetical protein
VNDDCLGRPFKCYDPISEGKWWASAGGAVNHCIKDMSLIPSGYSVKTHNTAWGKGGCFVRWWEFEGSDDDSEWEILDDFGADRVSFPAFDSDWQEFIGR